MNAHVSKITTTMSLSFMTIRTNGDKSGRELSLSPKTSSSSSRTMIKMIPMVYKHASRLRFRYELYLGLSATSSTPRMSEENALLESHTVMIIDIGSMAFGAEYISVTAEVMMPCMAAGI